jgi:hypothetical protein
VAAFEQLRSLGAVLFHPAAFGIEHPQGERRLHVAELIGARVPFDRGAEVRGHAEPLRIEAAQQCVRLRLAALGRLLRELLRRQILPLIERDVGGVVARRQYHRLGDDPCRRPPPQ